MIKHISVLLALTFCGAFAHAAISEVEAVEVIETCKVDASLDLKKPTQIFCDKNLGFADGVEIATNGHGLQIVAVGRVFFGTEQGLGLSVTAKASNAGKVFIYARTASGNLRVDNQTTNLGADIEIEYGSSFGLVQTLEPGHAAEVRLITGNPRL